MATVSRITAESLTRSELATTRVAPSEANLQMEMITSLGPLLSTKSHLAIDDKVVLVTPIIEGTVLRLSQVLVDSQFAAPIATVPGRVSGISSMRVTNMPHAAERSSHRSREMKFLSEHPGIFAKYVGEWVALESEKIIAHGSDPAKVVAEAKRMRIEIPFIFRVQPELATNEGTLGL